MKSLFIHDPADLDSSIPGGVQLCSREFLDIVRKASTETRLLAVSVTRAPVWRLRRKFGLGSYLRYRPDDARAALTAMLAEFRPSHIFLNRSELMRYAPLAGSLSPEAKVIVMSHGNQSGDDLYEAAGPGGLRSSGMGRLSAACRLGLDLVTESRFRHRHLHSVCVMSEEEETLERWLGATRTVVLPRVISPAPLDWQPRLGHVGFVGTLNHTPNRVALERLCVELARLNAPGLKLRLVGGPAHVARELAARHPFVEPLGRLDDAALMREISTWSLFLNPVFWLSRGASMKLGRSLAWGIPALTTRAGARGYELTPGTVSLVEDDASAFAAHLITLAFDRKSLQQTRDTLLASPLSPRLEDLAARLKARLA
jgi:hypothetical protein